MQRPLYTKAIQKRRTQTIRVVRRRIIVIIIIIIKAAVIIPASDSSSTATNTTATHPKRKSGRKKRKDVAAKFTPKDTKQKSFSFLSRNFGFIDRLVGIVGSMCVDVVVNMSMGRPDSLCESV